MNGVWIKLSVTMLGLPDALSMALTKAVPAASAAVMLLVLVEAASAVLSVRDADRAKLQHKKAIVQITMQIIVQLKLFKL